MILTSESYVIDIVSFLLRPVGGSLYVVKFLYLALMESPDKSGQGLRDSINYKQLTTNGILTPEVFNQ